ncbi:poly polymerase catalytic domain-containing protein [Cantharellus anzutake]|uniref:poly polymerase catalytic domain-containing protein n=1 Tax=Cantharellus anzutake TaxID=1750568 RepID=UPI0019031BBC|nr:poly polymerase catalytic domain-containing protein [Cantharellus anzutake]KAF8320542.1 poly polymerase catalytic domain-containing protein [Cantharellus anzutake]
MPPRRASARIAAASAEKEKPKPSKPKVSSKASKKRVHSSEPQDNEDKHQNDSDEQEPPKKKAKKFTAVPKGAKASKGRSKAKRKKVDVEEDEVVDQGEGDGEEGNKDEEMNEDPKDNAKEVLSSPSPPPAPAPAPKIVSVKKRGSAPVDPESSFVDTHQVYEANGEVWDCMLNQTNISNNNNKFYVIQLLHPIGNLGNVLLHTRWGRVGERGQSQQKGPFDPSIGIREFCKQFRSKTTADWANRRTMRDFNDDQEDEDEEDKGKGKQKEKDLKFPDAKAAPQVQRLVEFIFNSSFINAHLQEMNYDANKLPLGKLAKSTILNGFTALKAIAEVLADPGGSLAVSHGGAVRSHSHSFGRNRPVIISDDTLLKKELEMLDALGDMQIATKVLTTKEDSDIHPIDASLASLNLSIVEPLEHSSKEFKALEKYAQDTHGETHAYYKVQVEEIFRIQRSTDDKADLSVESGERLLLWHGSRSTNFAGILKQGLRIAPPEAPVSGYMFGKGVYFADHMSKSAGYCYAYLSQSTGLLLLAEVIAKPFVELMDAKYDADTLCKNQGMRATKGIGRVQPVEWEDCAEVLGNPELKGIQMPKGKGREYNEYIVYDTSQIRLRYLLRIKMQ